MKTRIIHLDRVDSTNTFLKLYSKDCAEEGIVISTKNQSAGRGQHGSIWQSKEAVNLTFSVLLCPDISLKKMALFNMMISCSVQEFISNHLSRVKIKWPNDLYIGNKKIAGILIENQWSGGDLQSIVGIGININQQDFVLDRLVTSFAIEQGLDFDLDLLLSEFLLILTVNYNEFKRDIYSHKERYLNFLYRKDMVSCFSKDGIIFNAIVRDINLNNGNIIMELEDDILKEFTLGEIKWLS